jgi:nitrous oxidase accessory protein NosD
VVLATALAGGSITGVATGAAAGPGAGTVQCGDTVTADVTLTRDLTCTGIGITIGASDVTVDLGGNGITGTDAAFAISSSGFDGITIRNGSLVGWGYGVNVVKAADVTVEDLVIETAPSIPSGFPATAVNLADVDGATVRENRISGGQVGIGFATANDVTITRNTLDSVQTGIQVLESTAVRVTDNATTRTAGGISMQGTANTSVTGNTTSGGISGIYVQQLGTLNTGNLVAGNTATGASSSGIFVDTGSGGVELRMNRADRNFAGIVVRSPETVLASNAADDNTQLGIDAVAGVTDAGGNTATGNGDARQCVGVVCGSGPSEPGPTGPGPTGPGPTNPGPTDPGPTPPGTPLAPLTPPAAAPPAPVVHASPRFTG